jgi:hypothetical protein
MRAARVILVMAVIAAFGLMSVPGSNAAGLPKAAANDRWEVYTGIVTAQEASVLRSRFDHDVLGEEKVAGKKGQVRVAIILNKTLVRQLKAEGISLSLFKDDKGRTVTQAATAKLAADDTVFRTYLGEGGIKEEMEQLAAKYPDTTKLETIGTSHEGTPIYAMKVTKNADTVDDGTRPAVLYIGTQHAREWISPEVTRRLMRHFITQYAKGTPEFRRILSATEVWFVPVTNVDGYDWTFEPGNRLWRKNLRDNNNDGIISASADGVDPNRNFPAHWGQDNEGSEPFVYSDTYRGPSPASEPETQAIDGLVSRITPQFFVNYHSAAELLLYGIGWQVATPSPDDVVYEALAGTDQDPGIEGYDPDLSAELYITNGDTNDHLHESYDVLGYTPELSECQSVAPDPSTCGSVFHFPDDEALVQAEFRKNIPFAVDLARSAPNPDDPISHLQNKARPFKVDTFSKSWGTPQTVATVADRELGAVTMHYQVNDGVTKTLPTAEWGGGERYGDTNDVYYHEVRAAVPEGAPGDKVTVWFSGGGKASRPFKYAVAKNTGHEVLVMAAEDYTGFGGEYTNPRPTSAPMAPYYTAALEANGITYDVWDVDAQGYTAPHDLGVLSHYDAVIWETGQDKKPAEIPALPWSSGKILFDETIAVRDYLNEGGKLLRMGKYAGFQGDFGVIYYGTNGDPETVCGSQSPADDCLLMANDFEQYWLGAYDFHTLDSADSVQGVASPLDLFTAQLNGPDSADNQAPVGGLELTRDYLPPAEFPSVVEGWEVSEYEGTPPDPFQPIDGEWYVGDKGDPEGNEGFSSVSRTIDLTGETGGSLDFQISHDTEAAWDFVFVEAHEVGTENWTTLPEANGHTDTAPGDSCDSGWHVELHPQLQHYVTLGTDGHCVPTGTTGEWNAASGSSGGWTDWSFDLADYADKQVEVRITYATDWFTAENGVFVDDVRVTRGDEPVEATSFETGLDGWTVSGTFQRAQAGELYPPLDLSSGVATADSLYFTFGLEGVNGAAARNDMMGRAMGYLLD